MKNLSYAKPIEDNARIEYAPASLWPNPGTPTEAEYNAAGWYRLAIQPPNPPEGKIVTATKFIVDDNLLVADYTYGDAPPRVRVFSKLKIVAALMAANVWPQVKAYIEQAGLYDLYLAAQDFREDNEYFTQGLAALKSQLSWSDAQVEAILSASEAEP